MLLYLETRVIADAISQCELNRVHPYSNITGVHIRRKDTDNKQLKRTSCDNRVREESDTAAIQQTQRMKATSSS
jgi:hypothetical protein